MTKHIDRRIGATMARNNRPDSQHTIAWRLAQTAVLAQVNQERTSRPALTADNVADELTWQAARIAELMKARGF